MKRWWESLPEWQKETIANSVLALFILVFILAIVFGKQP